MYFCCYSPLHTACLVSQCVCVARPSALTYCPFWANARGSSRSFSIRIWMYYCVLCVMCSFLLVVSSVFSCLACCLIQLMMLSLLSTKAKHLSSGLSLFIESHRSLLVSSAQLILGLPTLLPLCFHVLGFSIECYVMY